MPVTPMEDEFDDSGMQVAEDAPKSANGQGTAEDALELDALDPSRLDVELPEPGETKSDAGPKTYTEDEFEAAVKKRLEKAKTRIASKRINAIKREVGLEKARADELQAELDRVRKENHTQSTEAYDARFNQIKTDLKAAAEDTDVDRITSLTLQLHELGPRPGAEPAPAPAREQPAAPASEVSTAASDWLETNNDWFMANSEGYDAKKHQRAMRIEESLIEEGYSTDDPDLYEELDKRLNRGNGSTQSEADGVGDPGPAQPPPGPAAPADPTRQTRRLTNADLTTMKRWGFDPASAEDRRNWLLRNQQLD